jgi:hypothetical protein
VIQLAEQSKGLIAWQLLLPSVHRLSFSPEYIFISLDVSLSLSYIYTPEMQLRRRAARGWFFYDYYI